MADAALESPLTETTSIDQAINACSEHIRGHRLASWITLFVLFGMLLGLSTLLYKTEIMFLPSYVQSENVGISDTTKVQAAQGRALQGTGSDRYRYIVLALSVLVFGVFMSIYRFHLNEIAKAEHYKLGFLRIRIAANNTSKGFSSEVRQALTQTAFDYARQPIGMGASKKIESPLPGYPSSDLAALILNKVFDQIEVKATKKPKEKETSEEKE